MWACTLECGYSRRPEAFDSLYRHPSVGAEIEHRFSLQNITWLRFSAFTEVTVPTELSSSPPKVLTLIFQGYSSLYKFLYVCELRVKVHLFANKYTFDPGPFVEKIKLPPPPIEVAWNFCFANRPHICIASFEFVFYSLDLCLSLSKCQFSYIRAVL